jgi:hypothetical protein
VADALLHNIGFGYFEGRTGGTPTVDELWYLTTYPDVAEAVKLGRVQSATRRSAARTRNTWRSQRSGSGRVVWR